MRDPILEGRREFEGVFGDLAKGKRNWQLVAFAITAVLGVETIGFVRLALTSRVTPYVVEVDQLGRVRAAAPVERLTHVETRLVIAEIAQFVRDVRTVVPAPAAQADVLARAYAYLDQGGAAFLNAYFSDPHNDPRVIGRTVTRTIDVRSVLPVPKSNTWRVEWTEVEYPIAGGAVTATPWEGYLGVRLVPPETADAIARNPLGVYVTSVTWTKTGNPVPTTGETTQ
ncbi:MAG TPA: type IV secretion system protein [Gemmatimonadaceae bacterium]|jgi:type IV secretory pathway TrbF-like protein|nr:type IV secretion system protein [Gemmatimonadaceae bacterium]